jgi:thiamine-monophosphate kinase
MSGERDLIARLQALLGPPPASVLVGIGDDGAVVERPGGNLVATVDMQVEGIHFDRRWISADALGRRALAVNLSDLAAMGAAPKYALVSLGLSRDTTEAFLEEVYKGLSALAREAGVCVIGGNVSQSPERLVLDVTALGEVRGTGLRRSGAKLGDVLGTTGPLGRSGAGLECLRRLGTEASKRFSEVVSAYFSPQARVPEGLALAAGGATSAIDVSDGLASELHHLARASGVGFSLEGEWAESDGALSRAAHFLGTSARELALFGGGDYELLFTCPPKAFGNFPFARRLGRVTAASEGIRWGQDLIPDRGWDHLGQRS